MSDKWLHIQHNEVRDRNRRQREAQQAEVNRRAQDARNRQGRRS